MERYVWHFERLREVAGASGSGGGGGDVVAEQVDLRAAERRRERAKVTDPGAEP
ncbi:MAG: hypothetical protein M3R63_20605 [Actinomycetota bacterium]|nr:hypothetical protein [Actinomycetota bacterium]